MEVKDDGLGGIGWCRYIGDHSIDAVVAIVEYWYWGQD